MGFWLQLSIVFMCLFIGLLGISIFQKRLKEIHIGMIAIALFFTLMCTGLFVIEPYVIAEDRFEKDMIRISQELIEGDLQEADRLIRESQDLYGDRPEVNLYQARVRALQGNYKLAGYFYKKVHSDKLAEPLKKGFEKELEKFEEANVKRGETIDLTMAQYLDEQGASLEDYLEPEVINTYELKLEGNGNSDNSEEDDALEAAELNQDYLDEIYDQLEEHQDYIVEQDETLESHIEMLTLKHLVEKVAEGNFVDYEMFDLDGIDDFDDVVSTLQERYEEDGGVEEDIFNTLVKGYLIEGDYDEILNLSEYDMTPELAMVLAELEMNGYIDSEDVQDKVTDLNEDDYDVVRKQLEKVADIVEDESDSDEDDQLAAYLEEKAEVLDTKAERIGLDQLSEVIKSETYESGGGKDANYYLELAKIAEAFEDIEGAEDHIDNAINAATYCEDEELQQNLIKLGEAIAADGDIDEVKEIPMYVENIMDNVLLDGMVVPETEENNFTATMTNMMSQRKARINIMSVNTTNFPHVEAYLQIASDSDSDYIDKKTLEALSVYDTNERIENFEIEKIDVSTANIVLCFDTSGSMEDVMEELRQAGYSFIDSMTEKENVAIVSFDSYVSTVSDFTNDKEELKYIVSGLYSGGGTDIYGAATHSMQMFNGTIGNNVILMTDGLDEDYTSLEEKLSTIRSLGEAYGTTVYTIGLGVDVDAGYLQGIAEAGNGKFIYAQDAFSLQAFYEFLHGQVTNQYKITYTVNDTSAVSRELNIASPELHGEDVQFYKIGSEDEKESLQQDFETSTPSRDEDEPVVTTIAPDEVYLTGIDKNMIVVTNNKQEILHLYGNNFNLLNSSDLSIRLTNSNSFDTESIQVISQTDMSFVLPRTLPIGTYDIVLESEGKQYTLKDVLTLTEAGAIHEINFGEYNIRAGKIVSIGSNQYIASGNVTINNMLRFSGDVQIYGDVDNDFMLSIKPEGKAYVSLDRKCNSYLAQQMSNTFGQVTIGKLPLFEIYRDGTERSIVLEDMIGLDVMNLSHPEVVIAPKKIEIQVANVGLDFPFQKQLLKANDHREFAFDADLKGIITTKDIGIIGGFKGSLGKDTEKTTKVLNMNIIRLDSVDVKVDTMKGDYAIGLGASFDFGKSSRFEGISGKLAWTGGKLDIVELGADVDVPIMKTPVPVSLGDFKVALGNISKVNSVSELWKSKLSIATDINAAKMSDVIPGIKNILGSKDIPALFQVDDATASISLGDAQLSVTGTAKLFEEVTLANMNIMIGKYKYEQALLGITEDNVYGVHVGIDNSIDMDLGPMSLDANIKGALDLNTRALALAGHGYSDFQFHWWWINEEIAGDKDVLLSFHKNEYDNIQFTIILRERDLVSNRASGFQIALNRKDGNIFVPGNFFDLKLY